jgi:hypothetical protein
LTHTLNVAQRIQSDLSIAVDNIFVDSTRVSFTSTSAIINDLSDRDIQYLMIKNIAATDNLIHFKQRTRKLSNETVMQFQLLLKSET